MATKQEDTYVIVLSFRIQTRGHHFKVKNQVSKESEELSLGSDVSDLLRVKVIAQETCCSQCILSYFCKCYILWDLQIPCSLQAFGILFYSLFMDKSSFKACLQLFRLCWRYKKFRLLENTCDLLKKTTFILIFYRSFLKTIIFPHFSVIPFFATCK